MCQAYASEHSWYRSVMRKRKCDGCGEEIPLLAMVHEYKEGKYHKNCLPEE